MIEKPLERFDQLLGTCIYSFTRNNKIGHKDRLQVHVIRRNNENLGIELQFIGIEAQNSIGQVER